MANEFFRSSYDSLWGVGSFYGGAQETASNALWPSALGFWPTFKETSNLSVRQRAGGKYHKSGPPASAHCKSRDCPPARFERKPSYRKLTFQVGLEPTTARGLNFVTDGLG